MVAGFISLRSHLCSGKIFIHGLALLVLSYKKIYNQDNELEKGEVSLSPRITGIEDKPFPRETLAMPRASSIGVVVSRISQETS